MMYVMFIPKQNKKLFEYMITALNLNAKHPREVALLLVSGFNLMVGLPRKRTMGMICKVNADWMRSAPRQLYDSCKYRIRIGLIKEPAAIPVRLSPMIMVR